jgi:signal transduction histidine kinase
MREPNEQQWPPFRFQDRPGQRHDPHPWQGPGHRDDAHDWASHWGDRARRWRERGDGEPLRRHPEDRLAGGVAAGIAAWRGFGPTTVRIVLAIAALVSTGWAVPFYFLGWLLIPAKGDETSIASRARHDSHGVVLALGLGSLLAVFLFLAGALNDGAIEVYAWPQVFSVAFLTLIWRNAPDDERAGMHRLVQPLESLGGSGKAARRGTRLRFAGAAVLLGPWWLRIARDLVVERQARVRAEERADIAARVHDSVLQTLALIQRRADQPQQVVALARAQERELRSWLFDGRPPGSIDEATTLAGGVRLIQQEVEAQHGIAVEVVLVGDCPLDGDLAALLAAAREATVNAAKWSGASVISIFAEVEPAEVSVYVRDRGQGFDQAAVPADRKGVAESIRGRVARHGGKAAIRSTPGEGTEVSLSMKSPAGYKLIKPGQESTAPEPTR